MRVESIQDCSIHSTECKVAETGSVQLAPVTESTKSDETTVLNDGTGGECSVYVHIVEL